MAAQTLVKNVHAVILIAVILATFREIDGLTILRPPGTSYELINDAAAIITSPNYPNSYSSAQDLIWKFETAPDSRILLIFDSFEVEAGDTCQHDNVLIYDGHTLDSPVLGKFCGSVIPPPVRSTGNKMLMQFHTDGNTVRKGFKVILKRESSVRFIPGLEETERNLTQYYLRTARHRKISISKWGTHVTRTAVALYLKNPQTFAPGNKTGEEIAYELSLQLLSKLEKKKQIPTNELALYINALTVACIDPKDFFGTNLVDKLRQRVNHSNYTNPISLLTLCNAKDTITTNDVQKLQQQYDAHFRPIWTDTQAMVVMALSCISSRSDVSLDERILDEMVLELKRKQHKNGTIDNVKTTALVVQALIAAGSYQTDFDFNGAISSILQAVRQTYPSMQEIYYILPIFHSMSLANISSDHCEFSADTDLEVIRNLREHENARIQVQVSVIIGNDMDFSRVWKIKVPSNYSIYQVLENIGTLEPAYKARYSVSEGKPYVVGLSKFQDDTEDGYFWFIYTKPLSSTGNLKLIEESLVDIQVKETDEIILWYKSGFWAKPKDDSSG